MKVNKAISMLKELEEWFDFETPLGHKSPGYLTDLIKELEVKLIANPEKEEPPPKLDTTITFGKWKGTPFDDIPSEYLIWVIDNTDEKNWKPGLARYIEENQEYIREDAKRGGGSI